MDADPATAPRWSALRVLVTGGSGFVGRALTAALGSAGAEVASLSRHAQAPRWQPLPAAARTFAGSVSTPGVAAAALADWQPDVVFHLAAQPLVGLAWQQPVATFETNIAGTWQLLDACRLTARPPRVVVASSDQAYGPAQRPRVDETHPLAGRQPYDVSKSCADLIAQAYAHAWGLPVGIARCANVFGPGDLNFSRLIPGTLRSALRGETPLIRSDGTPTRDVVALDDIVAGLLAIAGGLQRPARHGRAYNLASGQALSVSTLTRMALDAAGRPDIEPRLLNEPQGEVLHKQIVTAAAANDLGWAPARPLTERLQETATWYAEHPQLLDGGT